MSRFIKYACAALVVVAVPRLLMKVLDHREDPHRVLSQLAADTNATLPRKLDKDFTLTKVELDGDVWRASYEVGPAFHFDPADLGTRRAKAIQQVCAGKQKLLLDKHITVQYRYAYRQDGVARSTDITIAPGSCA